MKIEKLTLVLKHLNQVVKRMSEVRYYEIEVKKRQIIQSLNVKSEYEITELVYDCVQNTRFAKYLDLFAMHIQSLEGYNFKMSLRENYSKDADIVRFLKACAMVFWFGKYGNTTTSKKDLSRKAAKRLKKFLHHDFRTRIEAEPQRYMIEELKLLRCKPDAHMCNEFLEELTASLVEYKANSENDVEIKMPEESNDYIELEKIYDLPAEIKDTADNYAESNAEKVEAKEDVIKKIFEDLGEAISAINKEAN
ncbi:MAG: hypothetical protein MHMPM18_002292 [Marteilia pararefringens]